MIPEDDLEHEADRLYPHFRNKLHDDDELTILAKKLHPHVEENFLKDVGKGVVSTATGMLRKALWALGGGVLAILTFRWFK